MINEDVLSDYTVVDLETTGLSPNKDKIIEIGALKIRNDEITDEYSTLINPERHINLQATNINGIDDNMVLHAPKIENVIQEIINFIGDDVIVGHNVIFDVSFLNENYFQCTGKKLNNDIVDTLQLSKKYLPILASHKLETLVKFFNISDENNHRALQDCKATYKVYQSLCNMSLDDINTTMLLDNKEKMKEKSIESYKTLSDYLFDVEYDNNNPFFNKTFVVSGELERMTRDEVKELIKKMGGYFRTSVSKKTNYLILGEYNELTKLMMKGEKSTKLRQAEELINKGCNIEIINEINFFNRIENFANSCKQKQSNVETEKKTFVFLGSLAGIIRLDAAHIIDCLGGELKDAVSGNTDYLVIGDYDESKKTDLDKLAKVDEIKEKGKIIHKISVSEFLTMIDTDKELNYIPVKSIFDYINNSLSARYKKAVILNFKESADGKTVIIRATAKETAWHQELPNKTILKIDFNNILLPKASKTILNELNVTYEVDEKSDTCCVDIKYFMTLKDDIIEKILIYNLNQSFAFSAFGCCSKFNECNEKLKCVHDDVLYSNACQQKSFLLNQIKLRRKYGLPVTKQLKYFDMNFNKFDVSKISVYKPFDDCCIMNVTLKNDKVVKINSDYLGEMQKPDFEITHKI